MAIHQSALNRMCCCSPLVQLAAELGYAVSDGSLRRGGGGVARRSTEWQEHVSEVAASTGLSGREVSSLAGQGEQGWLAEEECTGKGVFISSGWLSTEPHLPPACLPDRLRVCRPTCLQGLFELASKTYASRRSLQNSMDSSSEEEADDPALVLANATAGSPPGESDGNSAAAGRPRNGKPPGAAAAAAGKGAARRAPSMREEIDAW